MITYEYNCEISPDLDKLETDIINAELPDYNYMRWDEKDELLKICFYSELSSENKIVLDSLIERRRNQ